MDQFLTVTEAANRLRLSTKTLIRWHRAGRFTCPIYKFGSCERPDLRVKVKDVDQWITTIEQI